MEEKLPVVTKKPELETRELSVSRYISGRCDLSGFRCTMRKELFSKRVAHTKSEMLSIESRLPIHGKKSSSSERKLGSKNDRLPIETIMEKK